MTVCIIPARKNSKRIKNKNTINFNGKPIIYYAIDLAKKSNLFSKIVVSTDCKNIAKISKKYGAEVPFLRSKKLSDDYTSSTDVIVDAIKKIASFKENYHCCIYPTSVLTTINDLKKGYNKIRQTNADCLIPVTDYNFSPYRSFEIKKKWLKYLYPQYMNRRSQDLPKFYHVIGSFYFFKTSSLMKKNFSISKRTTFLKISRLRTIDINEYEDFEIAKMYFKNFKKK